MTEVEFFDKIHHKYREANDLIEGDGNFNIKRGMAHTMSGYLEDLFALYLAKKINRTDLLFYVDKVFSIRLNPNTKAKSYKPDLMIIDDNRLTHYFDLKSNLGWNRDARHYLEQKNDLIKNLRGKEAWIRDKIDGSVQEIIISKDLTYHMVVVFGGNINPETMDENIQLASQLEYVKLDVLHKRRKLEEASAINYTAFENIYESLEQYL